MAKKSGSGSIIQLEKDKPRGKCRKWQIRVCTGIDPRTGKYRTKTRRVKGTYSDAKEELRRFMAEVEDNKVQGRTSYTLKQYCEHYLELRRANKEVAVSTQHRQECQFKAVYRHLGHVKLESITPVMLNDMYIAMLKGDTLSGKPSSGSYVNQIHDNITLVFEQAKKEGILVFNPCDNATPPKMDTRAKRALKPEQAHLFLAMLDETNVHDVAYIIAITMGLRRGEICGLSWNDIDFANNTVNIVHSFDNYGNLKETKTKAGMRLLPLPDYTRKALLAHKKAQKAQYDRTNSFRKPEEGYIEITDDFPVIAGKYGNRVAPCTLTTWWTNDRARFGLDGWCLHEFRHTYLTLLALNGVHPKVMQELAGHYSSQITMDIYTHVNMEAKREAIEAVSKIF